MKEEGGEETKQKNNIKIFGTKVRSQQFNFLNRLRQQLVIIDKTDFIHALIDSNTKGFFMCRPRRSGKSFTIDTIKTFFSLPTNKDLLNDQILSTIEQQFPEVLKSKERNAYRRALFLYEQFNYNPKDIFKNFMVYKLLKEQQFQQNCGNYIVICINLDGIQTPWHLLNQFDRSIMRQYEDLFNLIKEMEKYMDQSSNTSKKIIQIEELIKQDISIKLKDLNNYLEKCLSILKKLNNDKEVIILIDEHQYPIINHYLNNDVQKFKEMSHIMQNFLAFLGKKNSQFVKFILVFGNMRLADFGLSRVNNLKECTVQNQSYILQSCTQPCSFTEKQVQMLCVKFGINVEQNKNIILKQYGGYKFGDKSDLCIPYSVLSYIQNKCKKVNYLDGIDSLKLLGSIFVKVPRVFNDLINAISGKHIIYDRTQYDLKSKKLAFLIDQKHNTGIQITQPQISLFQLLLDSGFFRVSWLSNNTSYILQKTNNYALQSFTQSIMLNIGDITEVSFKYLQHQILLDEQQLRQKVDDIRIQIEYSAKYISKFHSLLQEHNQSTVQNLFHCWCIQNMVFGDRIDRETYTEFDSQKYLWRLISKVSNVKVNPKCHKSIITKQPDLIIHKIDKQLLVSEVFVFELKFIKEEKKDQNYQNYAKQKQHKQALDKIL